MESVDSAITTIGSNGLSRLLQRPFEEVLRPVDPDLSLLPLLWPTNTADKKLERTRTGCVAPPDLSAEDDIRHIPAAHRCVPGIARYMRIDGNPSFCVYRVKQKLLISRYRSALATGNCHCTGNWRRSPC